ncbi:MAG: sigma-70 family RNA polymerase sigma factor [Bacteroidales bacterium]|nr:sigma-70 family RNA polymerase sigma factor [Bacteroidales bacterium]
MKNQKNKSFDTLFKSYARGMYNICLRMTGNKHDAEDILQEAFYLAFVNMNKLKNIDSFGAWLKKIVVNQCVLFLRKQIHFVAIDSLNQDADYENDDWISEISMEVINKEIQCLPDGCRVVFNLYLLENYSHKQIAEMMGISESTSKSQYHRAKNILRVQLKKKLQYGEV